jgi:benzoyl-CoA reductase/2-hydroxyglutaryl-CoA dehydratase subunit BcrC/BadD/HgdB
MWRELGLDLAAHDGLLDVLGKAYTEIFLSQRDRPQGMRYFDAVVAGIHGERVEELVEARKAGKKVVGTFCLFVPEEIILAANGISIGLCSGADVGTAEAERLLPRNTCALIKSFMGFKLAGVCPYIEVSDLIIGETTCDGKKKAYEIFGEMKPTFVLELPQTRTEAAKSHWRAELDRLTEKLEELTGTQVTGERLADARETVNAKRRALHRLARLRAAKPAPISGLDALLINQLQFFDDPARFTEKLNALCDELEERVAQGEGVGDGGPRVVVSGCPMAAPNWKLPSIIEKHGAVIVGEESCVGERGTRNLVPEEGDSRAEVLDAIAERYFKIDCACFTPNPSRLDHITEMARIYNADGVISYTLQFCTPYAMESHAVGQRLESEGVPLLKVETDYSMEDAPQLDTRVQAFLEMLA